MSSTDFFDDDLIPRKDRHSSAASGLGSDAGPVSAADRDEVPARPVSDLNLTRMAKRKEEMMAQAGVASREMDRVRRRQEELEHEKQSLEEMVHRQNDFEHGKREMIDSLDQSIMLLDKQEVQAARLAEIYAGTRQRFREMLQTIQGIDETAWPEEGIREELNKALVLIDDARKEYHRSLAKIEAAGGGSTSDAGAADMPSPVGYAPRPHGQPGFRYWLGVGFAVSLPLIVVLVVLYLLHFALKTAW